MSGIPDWHFEPEPQTHLRRVSETREYATTTAGLERLVAWLAQVGVTCVAMEATGVYWRPLFALLESDFEVALVTAAHIKNVPGRKTDIGDAAWIAQLAEHGLLRPSFVPPGTSGATMLGKRWGHLRGHLAGVQAPTSAPPTARRVHTARR